MSIKIQHKRGLETNLPTLSEAEIGFTTDSKKLFIGSANGNIELAKKADVDSQLADIENKFESTAAQESAVLGAELLDATGWTADGWTGDFATGFTHTPGNVSALSRALPSTGTKTYLVEFDTNAALPTQTLTVSIGGSAAFDLYRGTSITHYSIAIQSVSDGNLVITPVTGYAGTITNLSVREVTAAYVSPFEIIDSNGDSVFAVRGTRNALDNLYLGAHSGENNVTGDCNVGIGTRALQKNVAGFWNSAIGGVALQNNISGTRNVAIGYNALVSNVNGHRNIAIGTFSNPLNTIGYANVSIGADSMLSNVSGIENIAIGFSAQSKSTTASNNISIGRYAAQNLTTGNTNITIGSNAMNYNKTGTNNVCIGDNSGYGVAENSFYKCTLIGSSAGTGQSDGAANNVCIGYACATQLTTGIENTVIGAGAGTGTVGSTAAKNVILGFQAGYKVASGSNNNVLIGYRAGYNITTSPNNTIIGYRSGSAVTTGAKNLVLGYQAGLNITTGSNNIIIGNDVDADSATADNQLNIGGVIKGNISTKVLTLQGGVNAAILPTTDPHVAGMLWVNSNVLTVSAG